LIVHCIRQM
jgi:hypothetical protein